MAADDRTSSAGRVHGGDVAAFNRNSAAVDAVRFRIPSELDAGRDPDAAKANAHCDSGRGRGRGNEGRVWAEPEDAAAGMRLGAADRVFQRGEPAAGPWSGAPRASGGAHGSGSYADANRFAG